MDTQIISFEEVLKKYSHIRLAEKKDNQSILDFYKNEAMQTSGESISFARDPDFFAFYEQTAKKYWTFLFLNDDLSIGGMGTVLRHIRLINGQFNPVAYFCDLRISNNAGRKAKVQWRQFFPDVISTLGKLSSSDEVCYGAYTAILANNDAAINSLTKGGRGITYRYLNSYRVASFVTTGLFHATKFYCQEISKERFINFYELNNADNFLKENSIDLSETLGKMANLSSDFILLGVFQGAKLCAITCLSLQNKSRRLKVYNLNGAKLWATKLLKLKGKSEIKENGELLVGELVYTTLTEETHDFRNEIIEAVFDFLDKKKLTNKVHIINIYSTDKIFEGHFLKSGISFNTKGHLFEIHAEGEDGILPTSNFRFEGALL